ncbi:MAG: hypothetical protein HY921_08845 [Elusimicrobia bacterium]|nr:hypothetical protein [Elusimicrobiota bacterium]
MAAEKDPRKRRTLFLIIGAALSLLLPLGAAVYLKIKDSGSQAGPGLLGGAVFPRRAYDASTVRRIAPAATPAAPLSAPPVSSKPALKPQGSTDSSLDYIRGGSDYYQERKPAAAPPVPATAAPEPPAPEAKPRKPAKAAHKPVPMPKLKSLKGPINFRSKSFGTKKNQDHASEEAQQKGQTPDMEELLKKAGNLPQGSGTPDVNQLLKNIPK